MIKTEKQLAKAIMNAESRIEITDALEGGVSKIKRPSEVVWASVVTALGTSSLFWGNGALIGIMIGLPAILTLCGGVGGIVFVTLGAKGTMCAFRLLSEAKTVNVLTMLRDRYNLNDNTLVRK